MKNKKRLIILTGFLFLSVFLLGLTSAADICWVETSASTCTATTGGEVVMHLSASTNAHGELESYSPHRYSRVLCCNFGGGDTSCSGNNKIIGLSSPTNAHAERPENSRYNNNVCYDSLVNCFSSNANCGAGELEVLRLSSNTNAHIAGPGQSYSKRVCCEVSVAPSGPSCGNGICESGENTASCPQDCPPAAPPPANARAFWSDDNFVEITFLDVVPNSTSVNLVLENSGLSQGTNVNFNIREREFGPDTSIRTVTGTADNNGRVVATWVITSEDLDTATDFEEFYFVANGEQSGSLTLNVLPPVDCGLVVTCSDYDQHGQTYCESDYCGVASVSVPGGIDCADPNINCFCTLNAGNCVGAFSSSTPSPPPSAPGDGIINIGETCDGNNWGSITGCSDFGDFTGGTLSCDSTGHFDTSLCTGGVAGVYGDGIINTGETCDGNNWGSITRCSDFGDFTGGTLSCASPGHFDTSQCIIYGDGIINIGETCDGSNWGLITGCSDFDEFTGGTLSCDSTGHFDTSLCTGGVAGVYGDGIINLGETCDGDNWGGITGCTDFDEFIGGVLSCEAPGHFNTFQCISDIEIAREIGTCLITEGQVDENGCDDGFLTISWTGQWIWNEELNPGHEDPDGLSLLCESGGTRVIECPAQIKLPFFGLYNIIMTILLIIIIYFVLIRKNNKKN